jgi:predicted SAM-dependent methyltransferase
MCMSIVKETIKKVLPAPLKELLALFLYQQEQARRTERIAEKNRRNIDALLKSSDPIKLELGAGANRGIPGWTYADLNEDCDLTLDLRQPLPLPDNCVSMIYSSHLLEHFKYSDLLKFLEECRRVLEPGGIFSAAVPNARIYLDAYQSPQAFDPGIFCRYEPAYNYNSKLDYVNYMAYMDGHHRYMFDEENLLVILEKYGFRNVKLREFDMTLDMEVRNFQTIYACGVK